ncbi:unnamed protein product [Brachionus calyciflorus]|uniref:Uncharacterized protein n=1 Tax=Brachionus calyciflorus TaxID=104777 RepID=A0A814K323_9BILA|nr:unnamed protein product [Brachionus calyciflorus]
MHRLFSKKTPDNSKLELQKVKRKSNESLRIYALRVVQIVRLAYFEDLKKDSFIKGLNPDLIQSLMDREDKQNGERNSSWETMLPIGQQNKTQYLVLQTSYFQHQQQQPFFHPYQTTAQPGITVQVQQPRPFYISNNCQNFSTHKNFRNQYNQVQPQTSYQGKRQFIQFYDPYWKNRWFVCGTRRHTVH